MICSPELIFSIVAVQPSTFSLVQLSLFAIAFNVYRTIEVSRLMENLLSNSDSYPDFYFLGFWQTRYNNMISVNVFFAWIKVLLLT